MVVVVVLVVDLPSSNYTPLHLYRRYHSLFSYVDVIFYDRCNYLSTAHFV